MKITVLGAGSWGTALSMTLWKNKHTVYLWTHDENEAKYLVIDIDASEAF